jgi:hypothetical protein
MRRFLLGLGALGLTLVLGGTASAGWHRDNCRPVIRHECERPVVVQPVCRPVVVAPPVCERPVYVRPVCERPVFVHRHCR